MFRHALLPLIVFVSALHVNADRVLLIIADDLGRDSLARFNDDPDASLPPTPTIDALAAQGVCFDRAYAYATCSPTRASILTGRYEFRTGVYSPQANTLQPNEFTLAEAIIASGTIGDRLAHLGKWHLGSDADSPNEIGGWPHFAGGLGGGVPNYNRWSKTVNGISTNRYTTYATTDVVNDAVDWIESQGEEDWFLWLAFNAPHTPLHKPDDALHSYDYLSGTDTDIAANPRPYYEAMVEAMDTEIGRLLEIVDLETTTVIFIGDNGTPGNVLQAPFPRGHGKDSLYEGGVNVPMIIAGAGVSENWVNTTSDAIIHSVDLYRTILDLLGIDQAGRLPDGLIFDSVSFYPLLSGASTGHTRTWSYSARPSSTSYDTFMLADTEYKWIQNDDGSQEFYYLADGLDETINRIDSLNAEAKLALDGFLTEIEHLDNLPKIQSVSLDASGNFHIDVGWYANANWILEYRSNLSDDAWTSLSDYTESNTGESTVTLSHSTSGSQGFYRVVEN